MAKPASLMCKNNPLDDKFDYLYNRILLDLYGLIFLIVCTDMLHSE